MEKLLRELNRRKVLRSVVLYAMSAWVILQVIDVVSEPLLLPDWVQRTAVIATIIGFPIVALLSWLFDISKSGLVATPGEPEDDRNTLGFSSLLATSAVILLVSGVIARQWDTEMVTLPEENDVRTLAILPFELTTQTNAPHLLRLTEELAVRLVQSPQLHLASEEAVSLVSPGDNPATVATQLGVRYLLGGTISGSGETITMSVWLYDAELNQRAWSREFQNAQLYVVNDLVVNELLDQIELQPEGAGTLTSNAVAYDLYLQGLQRMASSGGQAEAVSLFEQALVEDPRFPLPHASLCRYHVSEYEAAYSTEAFELAERFCFRALTLDSGSIEVHRAMGSIYAASGQLEKARDSYNAALAVNPRHFASRLGLAFTYRDEDPVLVESILTELMRDNPGNPNVYSALQNLYFRLGRYVDAVEPARRALQLEPDSDRVKMNLTSNLILAGQFADAKALLLEMLQQGSLREGDIHSNLATVYFFEGDYAAAAELYTDALNREPENPVFVRNLADATWHGQGPDAARELFQQVVAHSRPLLQINADDTDALSCMVVAYGSLGDQQGLESSLRQAMQIASGDPQIHYDAAVAYARLGNAELSNQHAAMASELGYPGALIEADPDIRQFAPLAL